MNRIVFIIISLLMSLSLLVACSDNSNEMTGENENQNDNESEEVAAEPKEPKEPEETEENNDSNATNDGNSSESIEEVGDELDLPEGFPADIPLPDLNDSSITYVVAGAESSMGIAYHIELEYSGDKTITEMIDMYREYVDNNFDEDERDFVEEESSVRYIGYIDGVEHDFVIYESTIEEGQILFKIVIWAEE